MSLSIHPVYLLLSFHYSLFFSNSIWIHWNLRFLSFNLEWIEFRSGSFDDWIACCVAARAKIKKVITFWISKQWFFFAKQHSSQLTVCVYLLWIARILTHLGHCSIRGRRTTTTKLNQRTRRADEIRMKIGSIIVHILNAIRQNEVKMFVMDLCRRCRGMPHRPL